MSVKTFESIIVDFKMKQNVFLTGPGGSGKTVTINKLKEYFDNNKLMVPITAMTGAASLQFENATTLHKLLGIGISFSLKDLKKIISSKRFRRNIAPKLQELDGLIIDEISTCRADVLHLVSEILKNIRSSDRPFGGLWVMVVGDLFQLKPVIKMTKEEMEKSHLDLTVAKLPFHSPAWTEANFKVINLTKIYRQLDLDFIHMLRLVRIGRCTDEMEKLFRDTKNHVLDKPVKLSATNHEADMINDRELRLLDTDLEEFSSEVWGETEHLESRIIKDSPALEELKLKHGCKVIILKNGEGYVNGSTGRYIKMGHVDVRKWDGDNKQETLETLPALEIELDNGDYVMIPIHKWEIKSEKLEDVYDEFNQSIVKELVETVHAEFTQFPIKLGYCITTHRSQGMSLDNVEIDFMKFFTEGQAYVALSRVRSYKGLRCLNFNKRVVRADPDVFDYYMDLKNKGEI